MDFPTYKKLVSSIPFGKKLPDAVYIHVSAKDQLPGELQNLLDEKITAFELETLEFNLIKIFSKDYKISLLNYPDFFENSYPALHQSCSLDLLQNKKRITQYKDSKNPPILHRKETFLAPGHPSIEAFEALTKEGEDAGLYTKSRTIGFREGWLKTIRKAGYELTDGHIVPMTHKEDPAPEKEEATSTEAPTEAKIERHLTAISRRALSSPVQTLANYGFLDGQYSIFDYGCGLGSDVKELKAHGLDAQGWDPVHAADHDKVQADVVNLGFVINVIEDTQERQACLIDAYKHSNRLLVVSAMLGGLSTTSRFRAYGDGVVTTRNTFQKYYQQQELKEYIDQVLGVTSIAVAPGIFYVFRDGLDEQLFLSNRRRVRREWRMLTTPERKVKTPKVRESIIERHKELIEDFWHTYLDLGRRPSTNEFEFATEVRAVFGSFNKACEFLEEHYGSEILEQASKARQDDLLVYFALNLFERRKPYTRLPDSLKRDIKAFFGTYPEALEKAKQLLFGVGNPENILNACIHANRDLGLGYLNGHHSLQLHSSQVENLPSLLRIYLGCAEILYGDITSADLVKLHIQSGKVSLMVYQDFETKPLPEMHERIKIRLRQHAIDFFDYTGEYEPQPLYLKSRYIPKDFANYEKQVKFDKKLEETGIYDFSEHGPSKEHFYMFLERYGYKVSGFQLRKSKTPAQNA